MSPGALEAMLGWRYTRSIRGHGRLRFGATVAVLGIAIGVAALIIVLSVMNGYVDVINGRLLSVNAHLVVRRPYAAPFDAQKGLVEAIRSVPGIRTVTPYAHAEGFALHKPRAGRLRRTGVIVRGTTSEARSLSIDIDQYLIRGEPDIDHRDASGVFGALIGHHMAARLGAEVGDEVHVSTMPRDLLLGRVPPLRRYRIAGVFATGYYEFDANLLLVPLEALQRDLSWADRISGFRIKLDDPFQAEVVARSLEPILESREQGLYVTTWIHDHGNLYVWIRMQKWFSVIALSLIVIVAGFNIVSVLTVSVIERRRDIGILKAMGCAPFRLTRVFTLQGFALGAAGTLVGCLLGGGLCWAQSTFRWIGLRGDVYMIDALPVKMMVGDFALVSAVALLLCTLFTLLPARDAGALHPVEALRTA